MEPKKRQRKLIIQRLMGLGLLAICILYVWMASSGESPEERDCTALLLIAPMAIGMLFSLNILIY